MPFDAQRLQAIFLAAAEINDPEKRAQFLKGACEGDTELRARIEKLLLAHGQPDSLLDQSLDAAHGTESSATRTFNGEGLPPTPESDEIPLGFLAPATRPDSLGRIGHYEVLQILGHGGFGIVFRAFDDTLQRVVAVKVLSPQMASTSPARKRFLREARSSAQVRHENVVQVYEVGETPLPYIAMEFIPGETLQQFLDRTGPIDIMDVVQIGRQLAEGLAAAHANDLIHRDIKPGNILLEGGHQRVKLTDFGLARAADDASISQSGIIAGTPMYMAPEQAKGEKLDYRADLFSLGSVLYQMAAGRPPFRANGTIAVLKRVAEDNPRNIREIIPETPQWLCDIIAKLHQKNPEDRFQTAREVADILADCENQLQSSARLKDFSRIPRSKSAGKNFGRWKRVAATVLLLPFLALAVAEGAGISHFFTDQQPIDNTDKVGKPSNPLDDKGEGHPAFTNRIGMEFVKVPKGKSWLGGSENRPGNKEVQIEADFYMGKYEVTQEQWEKVMGDNPSWFTRKNNGKEAIKEIVDADLKRFPVESVSWIDCQRFLGRLNSQINEPGWVYRLPMEVEWEYACRGGPIANQADSAFDYSFEAPTNTLLPKQGNFERGLGLNPSRTCKVGSFPPNRLGLHDMHGNVWEICQDTTEDSAGKTQSFLGGGWTDDAADHRIGRRTTMEPFYRWPRLGLRLVRVPAEVKTPDYLAAEYVLALGGAVKINDEDKPVKLLSELPKRPFRLTLVDLNNNQRVTDDGLAVFRDCQDVKILYLFYARAISDAGLANFANCKQLAGIHLQGANVTDAGLVQFNGSRAITDLYLTNSQVTDKGLANFKGTKKITSLLLSDTSVTDSGLVFFQGNVDLDYLSLCSLKISDAGLTAFSGCPKIRDLKLSNSAISDLGIQQISQWKSLENLALNGTRVTDAGLSKIAELTKLIELNLANTRVTEAGVAELTKKLPKCKITWDGNIKDVQANHDRLAAEYTISKGGMVKINGQDREIRALSDLPNHAFQLTTIEIYNNLQVTDTELAVFKECASLTRLLLYGCEQVSAAGLAHFKNCKNLNELWLEKVKTTDAALAAFAANKNLKIVEVGNSLVTDAALASLKDCTGLERVQFLNQPLSNKTCAYLQGCKDLNFLDLRNTGLTDSGMKHFKDCKKLSVVWISQNKITDAGLAYFNDCEHLQMLDLRLTAITDQGLENLKWHSDLTILRLEETGISDAGIANLIGLKNLTELYLAKTQVTAKGVEKLAKELPRCKLVWDGGTVGPK